MKPLIEQDLTQGELRFVWAAIKTRNALKSKKIKSKEFDMRTFQTTTCLVNGKDCGTSHCIGGWIDFYLNPNANHHEDPTEISAFDLSYKFKKAAKNLFYPDNRKLELSKPKHGIQAIDNFLAGYSDPWKGVEV
jgi:hypothetical protein